MNGQEQLWTQLTEQANSTDQEKKIKEQTSRFIGFEWKTDKLFVWKAF